MILNCDLGEGFGPWRMGPDGDIMPHIDMANIACGFHAGDANVMHQTLQLAKRHGVEVGAHPGYLDLQGFGRRSIRHSRQEIINLILYQVSALCGMAQALGLRISYVKPHGALYNDMMANEEVRESVFAAMSLLNQTQEQPLALVLLANGEADKLLQQGTDLGIQLLFEAFADRRYTDAGALMPRTQAGALLTEAQMLAQVEQLVTTQSVTTESGCALKIRADTICVHGDNEAGVSQIKRIRALCRP